MSLYMIIRQNLNMGVERLLALFIFFNLFYTLYLFFIFIIYTCSICPLLKKEEGANFLGAKELHNLIPSVLSYGVRTRRKLR